MTATAEPLRRLLDRERALAATGVAGLLLAAACAAVVVVRGTAHVAPDGDLLKPASFDAAIGIYALTLAVLTPLAGFRPRERKAWRWATVVALLYFYFAETFAAVRGHDPRFFPDLYGRFDVTVAALFGLDAIVVTSLFAWFAARLWSGRVSRDLPGTLLGARWATLSAFAAFGVGFWMIAMQGRTIDPAGSAVWPHALGFHALQAVPLVGWLVDRGRGPRAPVHAAGALWLAATAAALAQAAVGRGPHEATPLTAAALLLLAGWAGALVAAWRAGSAPGAGGPPPGAPATPRSG